MSIGEWRYAHAAVIGLSHLNQNTECQDRLLCRAIESAEGEILIAAVADGAGSTSDGQHGAELACDLFARQVSEFLSSADASIKLLNKDFGKRWISYYQAQITEVLKETKKNISDYASTFVGAVIGAQSAAFYQIGDGAAIYSLSGKTESYRFAVEPKESEYINMTEFLTDKAASERLRFEFIEEAIEDLILFSDGISAVAVNYRTSKPHEPFLMPMIAPVRTGNEINGLNEKLEKFLASPKINEKTDDDKTIILASRAGSETLKKMKSSL